MSSHEQILISGDNELYGSIESCDIVKRESSLNEKDEARYILNSSTPLIVANFLQYFLSVIAVFSAGKIGPKELAAASLGLCTFNITGLALYQGIATALDSFCSQAFGSGRPQLVGLYFQRCSAMMISLTFLLGFIWWLSGSILHLFIDDGELVNMTQTYLRVALFGAPGLVFFETGKRFLQAQNIFNASTMVMLVTAPLSYFLSWILVWNSTYGLGFIGAPLTTCIIYWLNAVLLLLYTILVDGKKCWNGFVASQAFRGWYPMIKLAIPGVVMVEAEYLAFEILTIFAASFGTTQLAAQSIASNVGTMAFQLSFAVAVAVTTRIGNLVGCNDISCAKITIRVSYLVSGIVAFINFSTIYFGKEFLGRIFSDSDIVIRASNRVMCFVAVNQLADPFNVIAAGVLRGQGRQNIGSILNLVSYYVVALPVGYVLGFKYNMELAGLWTGLVTGVLILTLSEVFCIATSDWYRILKDCHSRHTH